MSLLCRACLALILGSCQPSAGAGHGGLPSLAAIAQIGALPELSGSGMTPAVSKAKKNPAAQSPARHPAKLLAPYGQEPDKYVLTFAEEFDRLDRRLWNDHIWYERSNPTINYAVEGGLLKIWPQRDANGQFFNRTLDTDGKFQQTYGYFEMEAKLPRGRGVWPAFWLFAHPGERRPEIDIMEAYPAGEGWGFMDRNGMYRPNVYAATVWPGDGKASGDGKAAGFVMHETHTDLSAGFHKYAVKWEPHRQTFYFDGKPIMTVNVSMSDPMYIILDLWFGGAAGLPDDTTPQGKSNAFEINYVRAWRFK